MKKRKIFVIVAFLLILSGLGILLKGTFSVQMQEKESSGTNEFGKLEVYFFDVGQGDATLIMQGSSVMLVDG